MRWYGNFMMIIISVDFKVFLMWKSFVIIMLLLKFYNDRELWGEKWKVGTGMQGRVYYMASVLNIIAWFLLLFTLFFFDLLLTLFPFLFLCLFYALTLWSLLEEFWVCRWCFVFSITFIKLKWMRRLHIIAMQPTNCR